MSTKRSVKWKLLESFCELRNELFGCQKKYDARTGNSGGVHQKPLNVTYLLLLLSLDSSPFSQSSKHYGATKHYMDFDVLL